MRGWMGPALVLAVVGALARQAAAQEPPANGGTGVPVIVEPIPAAATAAPAEQARAHELNERLFASQALAIDGARVTRNGVRVDTRSFYALVGRADLADQVHTRHIAKGVLIAGGATALTLGVLVGLGDAICIDSCNDRSRALPGALMVGGVAAILIGVILPSDPTDSREKHDLVDDYNRRLRTSLGLPF